MTFKNESTAIIQTAANNLQPEEQRSPQRERGKIRYKRNERGK